MRRRGDLSLPRRQRRFGLPYDSDTFGALSEAVARGFGTARFLVVQTIIVIVWIVFNLLWGLNIGDIREGGFDPYPFILLNLAFSVQAAYAAPLILLAQNRQEARDRQQTETDRRVAERTQADAEFLARELAGVRIALRDMATSSELEEHLTGLTRAVEQLQARLDRLEALETPEH